MSLFNRKQKVKMDEFCRNFYDTQILFPNVGDIDVNSIYFETVKQSIVEVSPSFAKIELLSFKSGMILIRFELFGLAWLHKFGENHTVKQSEFTKRYLNENGREDIWEGLEPYNRAIARSITYGYKAGSPKGRAFLASTDSMRMQMFKKWTKQNFDSNCIARSVNRLSSETPWKKNITSGFIVMTLCEHLNCELNEEAQFRLMANTFGLYSGVMNAIDEVKIEF